MLCGAPDQLNIGRRPSADAKPRPMASRPAWCFYTFTSFSPTRPPFRRSCSDLNTLMSIAVTRQPEVETEKQKKCIQENCAARTSAIARMAIN
jgi:hypothetical protein